ncbi:hypothetical protein [Promicromonospora sp. NPDC023805]|uniref:hypothetical protein n=1 Tax=Promicromonospora sp. NPDC023805 TaxID=3154696 RepID=UPI0033CF7498
MSSRSRRSLTLWLIVVPAWIVGILLGAVFVKVGASWTLESWQATHGGIQGQFTTHEPDCGGIPRARCRWDGEFRSYDGTYEVAPARFSGLSGQHPRATGLTVSPVVVAPGGDNVYYPDDKTWAFVWLFSALGPIACWAVVVRAHGIRDKLLERAERS